MFLSTIDPNVAVLKREKICYFGCLRTSKKLMIVAMVKSTFDNAGDTRDAALIPGWEAPLEQETATHSSILAWRIPWTGEPGGLRSLGSQRVRHE